MNDYRIPGALIRDHMVTVPLDWSRPDGATIKVFAREIAAPDGNDRPLLVYLQGGPGGKAPRPGGGAPGWLSVALKRFRVLMLDQRGTGRSTPVQGRAFAAMSAEEGAHYLSCLRADSIVRDAEHLRKSVFAGQKWFTLGQSYGGFLTLTYLSQAPEALLGCYVTGGMAGIRSTADEIYRRTYPRVADKNRQYFRRYPQDQAVLNRVADILANQDIRLADGDRLSVRRLQYLGMDLGMSDGFESLHWLLDEAIADDGQLSDGFLGRMREATSFDQNPLFAAIHESIYAQGQATDWAAERVLGEFPEFAATKRPLLFTGEMIYPWMFDEIRALRPFAPAAHALAGMPLDVPLYDLDRLAANEVPVTAAVYTDDMYVDQDLSLQTARGTGNVRLWLTNEYEHNGLRASNRVLERLFDMEDGLDGFNQYSR
ncbi:alpha/beta fold hydrolase [Paracoccus sp. CPCC 101403]|uniref:Alpha/beta fold hydrolase n=1 Tax=Paracoccus broussonetiae TaxID=3075834 RepID=A0ABU3E9K0_9RHOB|nr:alpha/beta fold hydrolase [Paracoccus sp. CPCC 101403]MDT1060831.1 alpha/beta fold hydrolase [Paracoccus sp. CPCC 101403]